MKTIVLCGSMAFKEKIISIGKKIEKDYNVLYPEECFKGLPKVIASRAHFDRITNHDTDIVLIINEDKNGKANYKVINSFSEIDFGFYHNKKVCLLYYIYEPYKDELVGWNVLPLYGDLNKLKES